MATKQPMPEAGSEGVCLNCGTALQGPYCHRCGQHDAHARKPAGFLTEAVEELTETDSKVFRTLGTLLWRPGWLSLAYVQGRRARYAPPVRLYLNLSVVLFLILGLTGGSNNFLSSSEGAADDKSIRELTEENWNREVERVARTDSAKADSMRRAGPQYGVKVTVDGSNDPSSWTYGLEERFNAKISAATPRALADSLFSYLPTALFLLLPFSALLLWVLFFTRYRHYFSHLVFALHMHSWLFVLIAVLLLLTEVETTDDWPEIVLVLGVVVLVPWYFLRGLRRFYQQRWGWILFKASLLGFSYLVLVVLMMTALGLYSVWALPG